MGPPTALCASFATLVVTGCFAMPDEPQVPANAPVELHPAAAALRGAALDDVVVRAESTLLLEVMDTGLVRRVAERAKSAVVNLYTRTETPVRVRLFPIDSSFGGIKTKLPGQSLGSGFLIHPSGLLISNEHVVRHATSIHGHMASGDDFELAIVATDPAHDLALLKVTGAREPFDVLPMGASDEIGVGDHVVAIGNPLGLGHSVTKGVVSQTGRNLFGKFDHEDRPTDFIQMDVAINPGSSGGPLLTLAGAWVGVNTATISQAEGISFAVPSRQVEDFLRSVLAGDGAVHGATE